MIKRIAIVAGLVAVTVVIVWLAETRNAFFDSRVYTGAVRYWFRDGGMVYDWLRPGTPYGFTYPPFAGLMMAPMAWLPFPLVLIIATVASVVTTGLIVWWLIAPMVRRHSWTPWFAVAIGLCLAVSFEPVRETITFGQVNTLLLALVAADLLFGLSAGRRWAGVGIGLATAIKLTPGVFILYLLVTRRWRAAFTAMGTATAATLLAAALYPDASREFWTAALWDTDRVGVLSYLSNQSLRGFVARLPVEPIATYLWIALVLIVLALWAWRVRRAPDDVVLGLALTGVVGTLISPVSWVHHCVWLLPALIRCVDVGWPDNRRILYLGTAAYVVMTSHLLWIWEPRPRPPVELIGSNLYVYFSVALLIWTPPAAPVVTRETEAAARLP
jgi:alpha-1,2-mannosyltransferase